MFSLGQDSKLLGAGHVVLNVIRAFNLIGLAAAMMASMAMPVLSGIKGEFYFFDMITHVFVFTIATFLLVSELPVPWKALKKYFERNWPVLAQDHSLAWLGWGMVFIGFQILGDLWKPAYTVEAIGLDWWRAILAAAILSATFGFFNIAASVLFRVSGDATTDNVKITSRQIRTYGNLALQKAHNKNLDIESQYASSHSSQPHSSPPHRDNWSGQNYNKEQEVEPSSAVRRLTRVLNPMNYSPMNFGNFGKSRTTRDYNIGPPQPIQPVDDDRGQVDLERGNSSHSNRSHGYENHNNHNNDRSSPIMPAVQRPPTALHPAFTGGSRYSEAHMDRF
jgi:hypothetical protein